jgi:hypothetical protein
MVDPHRWDDYPYWTEILYMLAPYGRPIPRKVQVTCGSFSDFTKRPLVMDTEEEAEQEQEFIDSVSERLRRGDDVPPLIRTTDGPVDGIHRAWAAHNIGISIAPIINVKL